MAITNKIDRQLLLDILTDGFESWSSRFWAQAEHYKWTEWYEADESTIRESLTPDTVLMKLRDVSPEGEHPDGDGPFTDITLENLESAAQWALENYQHILAPFTVNAEGIIDDINYDAIGADVILQKIVLGDAVYG